MRGRGKRAWGVPWLGSILVFCLMLLLHACGADQPYGLQSIEEDPPTTQVGDSQEDPESLTGCTLDFISKLQLKVKVAPGAPGANPEGIIESEPKEIPPLHLQFNLSEKPSTVTLDSKLFELASIVLGADEQGNGGFEVSIVQTENTVATGTYAEDGSITIQNISFKVSSKDLGNLEFPLNLSLTTGQISQSGDHGSLDAQGLVLASDKSLTLVGGTKVEAGAIPLSAFDNAALLVSFTGALNEMPDPSKCFGTSNAEVVFREIVSDSQNETELGLSPGNTLAFSPKGVFVPQAGVDNPQGKDPLFTETKTLRVKNISDHVIQANLKNTEAFTVTPSGDFSIAAGESKDFVIRLGFQPTNDYSLQKVPVLKEVKGQLAFGTGSVTLSGIGKRAAPELLLEGTDSVSAPEINFGIDPVILTPAQTLDCTHPTFKIPNLSRALVISNKGIRPLVLDSWAPAPIPMDVADSTCSPGPEFGRQIPPQVVSAATCSIPSPPQNHWKCTLDPNEGKVRFWVLYHPHDSGPILTNTPDVTTMAIQSNDPAYATQPLTISLKATISKDTSDTVRIRKYVSGTNSSNGISNKGNLRINLQDSSQSQIDKILELMNTSSDPLVNAPMSNQNYPPIRLSLHAHPGSDLSSIEHFKICKVDSQKKVASDSDCLSQESMSAVMQIPAMDPVTQAPGIAPFGIRFVPDASNPIYPGPYMADLKVEYVPKSTVTAQTPNGASSSFVVTLVGTVGLEPLKGPVKLEFDYVVTFIDNSYIPGGKPIKTIQYAAIPEPTSSLNLEYLKPGPLIFNFMPGPNSTDEDSPMNVTLSSHVMGKSYPSDPSQYADFIANPTHAASKLSQTDRRKMFRLFSALNTACEGGGQCDANDGIPGLNGNPACQDPADINQVYQKGDCSYFYYIIDPGTSVGTYFPETGEFTFPGLTFYTINLYHQDVSNVYAPSKKTVTAMKGALTTRILDYSNPVLYPAGTPSIPQGKVDHFTDCPSLTDPAWTFESVSKPPEMMCYLYSPPQGGNFLQGRPVTPIKDFKNPTHMLQAVNLVMLSKYDTNTEADDPTSEIYSAYVPVFMAGSNNWNAFQGRFVPCEANDPVCQ